MHRRQYMSGLGAAEDSVLSTDESAHDAATTAPASGSAGGSSGPGWDTVLATTISALPVIAGKAADAYHTYEEAHGGIPHPTAGGSAPGGGAPPHAETARPWYESPG